jgi:hypothetical protein
VVKWIKILPFYKKGCTVINTKQYMRYRTCGLNVWRHVYFCFTFTRQPEIDTATFFFTESTSLNFRPIFDIDGLCNTGMIGSETAIINRVHTGPLRGGGGLLEGWYEKEYSFNALHIVKQRQHDSFNALQFVKQRQHDFPYFHIIYPTALLCAISSVRS